MQPEKEHNHTAFSNMDGTRELMKSVRRKGQIHNKLSYVEQDLKIYSSKATKD